MSQVTIEAVTKVKTTKNNKPFIGVMIGGKWYNAEWAFSMDPAPMKGKTVDVESLPNSDWIKIASVAKSEQFKAQPPAGFSQVRPKPEAQLPKIENAPKIPWSEYKLMLIEAHNLASQLESEPVDAQARAAIVNTVMIAFTNGKIAAPEPMAEPPADNDPWEGLPPPSDNNKEPWD